MTDLALRTDTVTRDWVELMAPAVELARQVANTTFVPQGLRNDPPAIVAAILYGDEVGLGPMQSLAKISVINGTPTLSSEAQRALILAAGHELWVVESSITRVTVAGRRKGSDKTITATWTMDDAKRAGLVGKQNWKMYPRQMLLARAYSDLAGQAFADVIGGLASTEEAEEGAAFDENGEVTEPPKATTKRKRERVNTTAGVVTSAEPPTQVAAAPPPLPHELPQDTDAELQRIAERRAAAQADADVAAEGAEPPFVPPDTTKTPERWRKKVNVLVVQLRLKGHLTTEQVWSAVANMRSLDVDSMEALLSGRDDEGVLHWGPLLKSLTRDEASSLIDRLERYEQNLGEDGA